MAENKLYRGNVRDIIIVLSLISAIFFPITYTRIAVGLCVLVIGTLLHILTKATLIRNRVLCQDGVYRICRHPYYLSNFIVDMSFCLLSGNIYLVFVYPFVFFWAYGPTFNFEENKLFAKHPEEFVPYLLNTPQVFPYLGSFREFSTILNDASMGRVSRKEWVRISRFWIVAMVILLVQSFFAGGKTISAILSTDRDSLFCLIGLAIFIFIWIILVCLPQRKKTKTLDE